MPSISEFQLRNDLPLVTAGLPGVGGRIRALPEDFEVEEIPAYQPCGSGEHLYLWIEKREMGAEYFVRSIARRLGISAGEVGTAGLKDRHAITRQMVSVPGHVEQRLSTLEGEGIRVLSVSRHTNKLRPGHLHGNRFNILIRDTVAESAERLAALVERIKEHGLPNYYGPQRFGKDGETARLGLSLLIPRHRDDQVEKKPQRRINPFLRKLAFSAAQSTLFNLYLARRAGNGLLRRVLEGDVMAKQPFGGLFRVENTAAEQERFDRQETMHLGPIFGKKMFAASGFAAAREADVLGDVGLTKESFSGFGKLLLGTRRANLVYLDDLSAVAEASGVRLWFSLPAGSYATVLLKEVMKTENLDDIEGSS